MFVLSSDADIARSVPRTVPPSLDTTLISIANVPNIAALECLQYACPLTVPVIVCAGMESETYCFKAISFGPPLSSVELASPSALLIFDVTIFRGLDEVLSHDADIVGETAAAPVDGK